jgi:ribosome-binding factor A
MDPRRAIRVSEAIREELSELIGYEMSDPRVANIVVTEVQISPDLRKAQVRLSMPQDEKARKEALAGLEHAKSWMKRELAHRLQLFRLPELYFEPDIGPNLAGRLDILFKRIRKGRPKSEGSGPPDPSRMAPPPSAPPEDEETPWEGAPDKKNL